LATTNQILIRFNSKGQASSKGFHLVYQGKTPFSPPLLSSNTTTSNASSINLSTSITSATTTTTINTSITTTLHYTTDTTTTINISSTSPTNPPQ
jgi:hypothetical protein